MHIAMHAFGKITLFFCAGAIYRRRPQDRDLRDGRARPAHAVHHSARSSSAPSASSACRRSGGSWSKWYLLLGAVEAEQVVLVGVLMVSSLLTVAYLMPIVGAGLLQEVPGRTKD